MNKNKENFEIDIMMPDKNLLLNLFATENMMYDPSYYDIAINLSDDKLINVLKIIEINIKNNYEEQVYSSKVKDNLYRLLQIYHERFKDANIINKVNEFRSILNISGEAHVMETIWEEFKIRCLDIMSKSKQKDYRYCYKDKLENLVNGSISCDYDFFNSLVNDDKKEFVDSTRAQYIPLTCLSNLLYMYPYVLNDKILNDKILELLYENIEYSKYLKKKGIENEGDMRNLKDESNICLKRIKRLKLRG